MGKKINAIGLLLVSIILWLANYWYPHPLLKKVFLTLLAFSMVYIVFRYAFEETVITRIKDSKAKYSFKKTVSIISLLVFFVIFIRIWVEDTQALLVTYGLITAGIAITLQDVFKNFVGGLIIFVTGIYRVGDRIEIDSKYGDVIDIGILYTTLMELKEWVGGEQATGRLTIIPNGRVLSNHVNSYTKDHNFIWEEITIPITYDSDWKSAVHL